MSLNSFLSTAILLALIFENFEVVVCPRKPDGWGVFGRGSRKPSTFDAYKSRSKQKLPQLPKNLPPANNEEELKNSFANLYKLSNTATHISIKDYVEVREFIRSVRSNDLCMCGVAGLIPGNQRCLEALVKFQRVPKNMRGGNCKEAYLARCYKAPESEDIPMCSFYMKASPGPLGSAIGYWQPLAICAQDIENPPALGTPGANWILDRK